MEKVLKYNLNDFRIYYINLLSRKDRKISLENELKRLKLNNFCRVEAIYGKDLSAKEKKYWLSRKNFFTMAKDPNRILGRVGCMLSHLKAIKTAIDEYDKYNKPVLILEDDCKFLIDNDVTINIPYSCDLFYLGGLYWYEDDLIHSPNYKDPFIKIQNPLKIACAFSYLFLNKEKLVEIYKILEKSYKRSFDILLVNLIQSKENSFIMNPPITIQGDMFLSDVTDEGEKTPSSPYEHNYYPNCYFWTIDNINNYYRKPFELPNTDIKLEDLGFISEKSIKTCPNKSIVNSFKKSLKKIEEKHIKSTREQQYIIGILYLNAVLEQIGRFFKKKYKTSQLTNKHIELIKKTIKTITEKLLKTKLPNDFKDGIKKALEYYLN